MLRWVGLVCIAFARVAVGGDAPEVETVCELLASPNVPHAAVLIAGKISKQGDERRIEEDSCNGSSGGPKFLTIHLDHANGPLPPPDFTLPSEVVRAKFREVSQHTTLREFRFGSGDYEQWAIVYGRVENGSILCRSDALIFLWDTPAR